MNSALRQKRPPERGVPTPQQVGRTQDAASGETALLGDFEDVECLPDAADLEVHAPRGASGGGLALGEGGLGFGEVGMAEAGVDLHRPLGMGQGLGGPALAQKGMGEAAFVGGD